MHDDGVALGVIGTSPTGHRGPVRAGQLRDFQRLAGELEGAPAAEYYAGHSACHALMNGVDRVAFAGVPDLADEAALLEALASLVASGPLDLIVAPGVLAAAAVLTAAFLEWEAAQRASGRIARTGDVSLWLDAPDRADPLEVIARQRALSPDPDLVRVATPWVPTVSPGRRRPERLPPTCLVAPLYLATANHLRGVHEVEPTEPEAAERLRDADCALLEQTRGRRRVVRLAFPEPRRRPVSEPAPVTLEARIEAALADTLADLVQGLPKGPSLFKRVARNATAVLQRFVATGEVTSFRVRCDEETSAHLPGGLGIDVLVKVPKRVETVTINVSVG